MYFTHRNEKIIRADIKGGIYVVLQLVKRLEETAFCAVAPVKVNQLLSQPKIIEPWQLQTNTVESQLLQSRTAELQPFGSVQANCKARPKILKLTIVNLSSDIVNPSSIEHCNHQAYIRDSQSETSIDRTRERPKTIKKQFEFWYRRFAYCNLEKLQYLHKVTGLKKRIQILSSTKRSLCKVCKLSKLQNQICKKLSLWKDTILELVLVNVCGLLPRTLRGNQYFGQIVDNTIYKA